MLRLPTAGAGGFKPTLMTVLFIGIMLLFFSDYISYLSVVAFASIVNAVSYVAEANGMMITSYTISTPIAQVTVRIPQPNNPTLATLQSMLSTLLIAFLTALGKKEFIDALISLAIIAVALDSLKS